MPDLNEPKVAIIILNWNGFHDSVECLESVFKSSYSNFKVILVDNNSENGEGKKLLNQFPNVFLIQNTTNRGFSGGNNDGMNWALDNGFDYIVNLNNDCLVEREWLSKLVGTITTAGADFGSSMILFTEPQDAICSAGDVLFPDGSAIPPERNLTFQNDFPQKQIFSACGAGSIYSRYCLTAVKVRNNQYFDELFFAYNEDTDLGIRLNNNACKGILVPDAIIYHKHSKTAGKYSALKIYYSEKNRLLVEFLNFPIFLILFGELFFVGKMLIGFVYSFLNKRSKGGRYRNNMDIFLIAKLFLKARWWIILNFKNILIDRAERRNHRLFNPRIYRYFHWNLSAFLR